MISVQCACGKAFMTKPANAGKKTKCPTCGNMLTIPGGAAIEVSARADEIDDLLGAWPPVSSPPPPPTPAAASAHLQVPRPASTTSHPAPQQAVSLSSAVPSVPATSAVTQPLSRTQGTIIICLLIAAMATPGLSWFLLPKWEYQTLEVQAIRPQTDSADSIGLSDFMRKTVPDATSQLRALGQEGWELTAVFLEDETVHPNFGKENLVTGLQPNTRPQKLVCLLKRRKRF